YSFCATAGCANTPLGALIIDSSGNLYGTLSVGGANGSGGEVYELVKPAMGNNYTFVDIYDFCTTTSGSVCTDGNQSRAGLTYAGQSAGNDYNGTALLFGNTLTGGSSNLGTVFALQLSGGTWSQKVIHSFAGPTSDGSNPSSSMWMDASNNLWGTTVRGGSADKGSAFELTPGANQWTNAWTETLLYNFCWTNVAKCPDGNAPGGIVLDGSGNIFGAAEFGGNGPATAGNGVVFELTNGSCTEGGVATFWCNTVEHNFCSVTNCTDGELPDQTASLVMDGSGNLFGATMLGGTGAGGFPGGGIAYELNGVTFTKLYDFCTAASCGDGENPKGSVIIDASDDVYGVTGTGGDATNQAGVVYELTP
ncbi:MAG TPA: choice-of-anchor tandem repeat GloVer-containing protein, partial [Rhizomicrobium sp.]|nr:choice-of-anchor tandem repeat GloVer-containing protein [Rhizomicrobium sp.]